jgi:hypothetical protein
MDSTGAVDREQLDKAADLLMASLRKSRDLNIEIRHALLAMEKADATRHSEDSSQSDATIFGILRDIINGASRP